MDAPMHTTQDTLGSKRPLSNEALSAQGVNPATQEAQEMREMGTRPAESLKKHEKQEEKDAPETSGGGEEAAGLAAWALQAASAAALRWRDLLYNAAVRALMTAKEKIRQYGAAAVIDAERLSEASKVKGTEAMYAVKEKAAAVVSSATMKAGEVLKRSGEKLAAVGERSRHQTSEKSD